MKMRKLIYILMFVCAGLAFGHNERDIHPIANRILFREAATPSGGGHNLLSPTHGDTTSTTPVKGDIIYSLSTGNWRDLAIGANDEILRIASGLPDWQATTFITGVGTITTGTWNATAIDISDYTNLAVTAPIVLTDDTISITVAKDIVAGVGLSGGEDNVLPGADADTTLTFDATELDAVTWSDGANASNIWTFDVSGTDPTITFGNGDVTFNSTINSGAITSTGQSTFDEIDIDSSSTTALLVEDDGTMDNVFVVDTVSGTVGFSTVPSATVGINAVYSQSPLTTNFTTALYQQDVTSSTNNLTIKSLEFFNQLNMTGSGTEIFGSHIRTSVQSGSSGGTFDNIYGQKIDGTFAVNLFDTITITNWYQQYISNVFRNGGNGTFDTLYGIYIEDIGGTASAATTNWAIMSKGGDWILNADNQKLLFGGASAGDASIFYNDGVTDDLVLQPDFVGTGGVRILTATEGASAKFYMDADQHDDAGDSWLYQVDDGGVLTIGNDLAVKDTYVPQITLTPNATVADSLAEFHGDIKVGESLSFSTATELTISSGAVTVTKGHHRIDTEADASNDDLDTIDGGIAGEILLILPADDARTVRIRNGVGNIFLKHQVESKSFSFSSPAGSSGTFYSGGYYNWSATEAALTQASLSVTHSAANSASACHIGIVAGGAGAVDTGVVKLTVTGTTIDDDGNRSASQTVDLVADINALSLNDYVETTEKWIGQVTIALEIASGSPVNFSLDINYGCSKYEDFGNQGFTINVLEVVGLAGANDSGFNLRLFHHSSAGWTFAASGFVPGGTVLANMNTDYSTEDELVNGESFAYKRVNLNTDITGDNSQGLVLEITTSANKAVEIMDIHFGVHTAPNFSYMADTKQHLIFMKHGANWLEL